MLIFKKDARGGDVSHLKQHWPQGLFLHQALATGGNVTLLYIIIWRQKSCLLYTEKINGKKTTTNQSLWSQDSI